MLDKLQKAGFTANFRKCEFFKDSVSYLGFVIDANGLHKDKQKEQAIVDMPTPTNVTQVKSFCGLVNYYARFFPNLAMVLKPLYDLTSAKFSKFVWSDKCIAK